MELFTGVFEDAETFQTVTYCDSPQLILQILEADENINIDSLEAIIGDSTPKKYREKLTNHADEAYRMKELIENNPRSLGTASYQT